MIDCKECNDYAQKIFENGDIPQEDIDNLALDRHLLKGCESLITLTIDDSNKIPMDIIVNGFSIKETIVEVLNKYNTGYGIDLIFDELNVIAEEIKEAFAVKLKLKQSCKHQHDGMIYTSNPPQNKCKLCGEFYR